MNSDFLKMMSIMEQGHSFDTDDYSKLENRLALYEPVATAAAFSSLSLISEYQSKMNRLEKAVHCCLSFCKGNRKPNNKLINDTLNLLTEMGLAVMEDPAEDVLASTLWLDDVSYRVSQGLWESGIFYTQLFLDIVGAMPRQGVFENLFNSVKAILTVSDEVLKKHNVELNKVTDKLPHETSSLSSIGINLFNGAVGVDSELEAVLPILELRHWHHLHQAEFGNSQLEGAPFLAHKGRIYLILPSAVTICLRRLIISFYHENKLQQELQSALASVVQQKLWHTRLLYEFEQVPFKVHYSSVANGWQVGEVSVQFAEEYSFHFIFIIDSLAHIQNDWFAGMPMPNFDFDPNSEIGEYIATSIKHEQDRAKSKSNNAKGITFVVPFMFGVGTLVDFRFAKRNDWLYEVIHAADLDVISNDVDCSAYKIWRMLEAKTLVEQMGVRLQNPNRFLNLYCYAKENNYSLVPHDDFHEADGDPKNVLINIPTNCLAAVREKVANDIDTKLVIHPKLGAVKVKRAEPHSEFEFNDRYDLYSPLNEDRDVLRFVYVANRTLWVEFITDKKIDRGLQYKLFEAVFCNISRMISVLEQHGIATDVVKVWRLKFEYPDQLNDNALDIEIEDVKKSASFVLDSETLTSSFTEALFRGFKLTTNVAEQTMIRSFVDVVCTDTRVASAAIMSDIFVNEAARQLHFFTPKGYSDYLLSELDTSSLILIEEMDDKIVKLDLGWLNRDRSLGNVIKGKEECTEYLQGLVGAVWSRVQSKLKGINRGSLIVKLLLNMELIEHQNQRWIKTFGANLARHPNKENVYEVATLKSGAFTSTAMASRILVEMAVCETLLVNGKKASIFDIRELLCLVFTIHRYGDLSEAIYYEAIPPRLAISTFGDILFNHNFADAIFTPFMADLHKLQFDSEVSNYSSYYEEDEPVASVTGAFAEEFVEAWFSEFGFTIDDVRQCMDFIDKYGWEQQSLVFKVTSKKLNTVFPSELQSVCMQVINAFTLFSRKSWQIIPPDFKTSDWKPWKFRRRFSSVCRPIVGLDEQIEELIISPGYLRRGFIYFLRSCYEATLDENHFKSKGMRKWIGKARKNNGLSFNSKVANKFKDNGWQVYEEIKLPEILNKKMKDFGDIDVLAWHEDRALLLVIECKNLSFAKTQGEVARQLDEFKGVVNSKGKNDRLHKHVLRVNELEKDLPGLRKFIKTEAEFRIQAYIVFSELVPLNFVNTTASAANIELINFSQLDELL